MNYDSPHVCSYELCYKGLRSALFLCECGKSRTSPVEFGRIILWTSAIKPRQPYEVEANYKTIKDIN